MYLYELLKAQFRTWMTPAAVCLCSYHDLKTLIAAVLLWSRRSVSSHHSFNWKSLGSDNWLECFFQILDWALEALIIQDICIHYGSNGAVHPSFTLQSRINMTPLHFILKNNIKKREVDLVEINDDSERQFSSCSLVVQYIIQL